MSLESHPNFSYQPLPESDAIRLILLHPAQDVSAELECSIEHAALSQYDQDLINHFTALSYVWGDPTETTQILVNRCSFHVTSNLDSALRHLRDTKSVIRVWADALCINQSDTWERNHQVQQMGPIYSTAQHTVIYLGDGSAKSDSVFSDISASLAQSSASSLSFAPPYSWYGVAALNGIREGVESQILTRPWFTRVWVFQELLLSRDPWVQCGHKRLRWGDFCRVVPLARDGSGGVSTLRADEPKNWGDSEVEFDSAAAVLIKRVGALERLADMDSARHKIQILSANKGRGNSLLALLALRRGLGVSDARDMIYAHLGIASDFVAEELRFNINYNQSCSELFTYVAQCFIEIYQDYRILSLVEDVDPLRRRSGIPSWVPDWTSDKVHDLHVNPPYLDDDKWQSAKFSFSQSTRGKHQLVCEGDLIRKIRVVGANVLGFSHLTSAAVAESWAGKLPPHEPFRIDRRDFEIVIAEVEKFAGLGCLLSTSISNDSRMIEWKLTLSAILSAVRDGILLTDVRLHSSVLALALPFHFFPKRHLTHPEYIFSNLGDLQVLEGRRLCLYGDDQFALVPESTQEGDVICHLYGDNRRFVFRPIRNQEFPGEESTDPCFSVLGMCYTNARCEPAIRKTFILQ